MANEVKVTVTAKDFASQKIKEIGTSAEKAADKLRTMRGPLLAVGAALAGVGVIAIKNASDMAEAQNATEETG